MPTHAEIAKTIPGWHVISGDNERHLGTYKNKIDAKNFIEQQLYPNGNTGYVVRGANTPDDPAHLQPEEPAPE